MWRPTAGVVTLEVEVAGKRATLSATPLEASLLLKFSDGGEEGETTKAEWRASELAAALKVRGPLSTVVRAAGTWVSAGLLSVVSVAEASGAGAAATVPSSSSDPFYRRASALPSKKGGDGSAADVVGGSAAAAAGAGGGAGEAAADEEEEAGGEQDDDAAAANTQMLEAFVLGMLTNFEGGLPTDRIHSMLKMFATDPPYEAGMGATAALLARMGREEKVVGEGSVWRKK